ncbi:hypothetical protein QJS04_geneDACA019804 [Acorus gramineus]|uniref:Uncharacterized protein n=1 Tax=Acorus gramineus TaxID=55184 RepID=A0AAV9BTY9_ACOGR|nr:hypothetical protein QJS04_geneDACA019804 [Acorus gramineus]
MKVQLLGSHLSPKASIYPRSTLKGSIWKKARNLAPSTSPCSTGARSLYQFRTPCQKEHDLSGRYKTKVSKKLKMIIPY